MLGVRYYWGMEMNQSSCYIPMLLKIVIWLNVFKMYITTRSAIRTESNDPMVTSKSSVPVFTQVVSLLISIYYLHANIILAELSLDNFFAKTVQKNSWVVDG